MDGDKEGRKMQMKQVTSSHIQAVGYDSKAQELHVEYRNGTKYAYKNVPPETAHAAMNSHSIGSFLHNFVKGVHEHERV
jgi:hypothetical protein